MFNLQSHRVTSPIEENLHQKRSKVIKTWRQGLKSTKRQCWFLFCFWYKTKAILDGCWKGGVTIYGIYTKSSRNLSIVKIGLIGFCFLKCFQINLVKCSKDKKVESGKQFITVREPLGVAAMVRLVFSLQNNNFWYFQKTVMNQKLKTQRINWYFDRSVLGTSLLACLPERFEEKKYQKIIKNACWEGF